MVSEKAWRKGSRPSRSCPGEGKRYHLSRQEGWRECLPGGPLWKQGPSKQASENRQGRRREAEELGKYKTSIRIQPYLEISRASHAVEDWKPGLTATSSGTCLSFCASIRDFQKGPLGTD